MKDAKKVSEILDRARSWKDIDLLSLGLKVGLEVHRELAGRKLFCSCPSVLSDEEGFIFRRRMHITRSETGDLDDAALHEVSKGMTITYQAPPTTCLVEMDDEPPYGPSKDALETSLKVAMKFGCDMVDRIQFMRKIVVDGSNPSGFQRTALVGFDGVLFTEGGTRIEIESLCLEEDSGRRIGGKDDRPVFRLDRAGIPELEITTRPLMVPPESVKEAAMNIGDIIRFTGRSRRGLGSVRQDINISIEGGARNEIKLVQDLSMIPVVIRKEAIRQALLVESSKYLSGMNVKENELALEFHDVSSVFTSTVSKVIGRGMEKGGKVICIRLPGFKGVLGRRMDRPDRIEMDDKTIRPGIDDVRVLGPEIAFRARSASGVKGVFHSDELPSYGISKEEVEEVASRLEMDVSRDAFVMVCAPEKTAYLALEAVMRRVKEAFLGVPSEVRRPLPEGGSEFMRPMPGSARMYPETDIPPLDIPYGLLNELSRDLPPTRTELLENVMNRFRIGKETASQIVDLDLVGTLENICNDGSSSSIAVRLLLSVIPEMKKGGYDIDRIPNEILSALVDNVSSGKCPRECMGDVLVRYLERRAGTGDDGEPEYLILERIVNDVSKGMISEKEARDIIRRVITARENLVREKGERAHAPLMGPIMNLLKGKMDGRRISILLREELDKHRTSIE